MFQPDRKYSLAEIETLTGHPPTRTPMSYAVVYSVIGPDYTQYDFILFPYDDGDALILVAVDGEIPSREER